MIDDDIESHVLIIRDFELEDNKDNPTLFIMGEVAKYANKLGKGRWVVKDINYDYMPGIDDIWIEFLCERT